MSDNNCNVKRLSVKQLDNILKNIKENIIKDNDEYKVFTKEKIMKLLNIYKWENDFYIGIKKDIDTKVGGIKSKKTKTRNKRTKSTRKTVKKLRK
jgi:hypothetical protein